MPDAMYAPLPDASPEPLSDASPEPLPDAAGPLRIGAVGTSSIARRRMLPAFRDCPDVQLTAVAGRDPGRTAQFAAEFGGRPVTGHETLLTADDVDAVYVSLPNALHHPAVRLALQHGKHVLVEKPATTSARHTAELLEIAARHGLVLRENFAFEAHGRHHAARELINAGRLGDIRDLSAAFCIPPLSPADIRYSVELGGGALLDQGVYPIRVAQFLLGNDLRVAGAVLHEREPGLDLAGSALLCGADGVTVTARFGMLHRYGSEYQLWGSRARLTVERAFTPPPELDTAIRLDGPEDAQEVVVPAENQYLATVSVFAAAVAAARRSGSDPDATARLTTLTTARLVDEIRNAAADRRGAASDPAASPAGSAARFSKGSRS